jgi:glycosyltransferase involved in cell wall biosynthesis
MIETVPGAPTRLRLSVLADQIGSPVGGGRFIRGFLAALFSDTNVLEQVDHIYIVATQNESVSSLGSLPPHVSVVKRRFPTRLRQTPFARLFGYTLPAVDVAYGPFYYNFPCQAQSRVVTMHDLSCFDDRFHPAEKARKTAALLTKMAHECEGVVCISDATLFEFKTQWPHLGHKAVRIYSGVSSVGSTQRPTARPVRGHSILAVGTIEPRKNYPTLLDAFERLIRECGDTAPALTVVGSLGWMSNNVENRLRTLQAAGRCRWLRDASDDQLADAYSEATVFTYLSLYEGFGYPPFEAALARCPMVLSNASSVGEIWSHYARCVDPLDVEEIVAGWKWALGLAPMEREAVVACQERRAREFTWSRTVNEYMAFWNGLVSKHGTVPAQARFGSGEDRQ